jgi:hypothetical protein
MNTQENLGRSLPALFSELVYGPADTGAFILNRGDSGLLASLDVLSPAAASHTSHGGASIAAHVAHVTYGLSLMNRWAAGEADPFTTADWSAAWKIGRVSSGEWANLREGLRNAADAWIDALESDRQVAGIELDGVIGSIVHLAYHLGAMRQIDAQLRGPKELAS